jgi:hypothetical protein
VNKHPVPLSDVRSDVPAAVARSIERCLEKGRDERFQNVADLRFELAPFAQATREQRVGQALRTLDAADQGRLPTPLPDELLTRALRAAPVPTFEDDRWVATTASGVASQAPSTMKAVEGKTPKPAWRKRRMVALVGAGAVGGALLVAATMGTPEDHGSPDTVAVAPVEPAAHAAMTASPLSIASASAAPVPPAPSMAAAPPPPIQEAPVAPTQVVAAPPSLQTPQTSHAPRRAPSGASVAAKESSAGGEPSSQPVQPAKPARAGGAAGAGSAHAHPTDPNAVLNPFD